MQQGLYQNKVTSSIAAIQVTEQAAIKWSVSEKNYRHLGLCVLDFLTSNSFTVTSFFQTAREV